MISPYMYLALATILFGAGFATAHKLDQAEVLRMQLDIQAQNTEAATKLSAETTRVKQAEENAIQANQQLDKAHEQSISTINALHDSLADARLFDPGNRPSSRCLSANSDRAGVSDDSADNRQLSDQLTGFLTSEAQRADLAAEYAGRCYQFVTQQHCGIEGNPR